MELENSYGIGISIPEQIERIVQENILETDETDDVIVKELPEAIVHQHGNHTTTDDQHIGFSNLYFNPTNSNPNIPT